jgi:hypothetical protein
MDMNMMENENESERTENEMTTATARTRRPHKTQAQRDAEQDCGILARYASRVSVDAAIAYSDAEESLREMTCPNNGNGPTVANNRSAGFYHGQQKAYAAFAEMMIEVLGIDRDAAGYNPHDEAIRVLAKLVDAYTRAGFIKEEE